jgi:hypothetical protein
MEASMSPKLREPETLLGLVGLLIGILQLVIFDRLILRLIGLAVAVVLIAAAVLLARRKHDHIDDPEVVKVTVGQATADDVEWVAERQRECFGKSAVPRDVLLEWYAVIRNAFFILRRGGSRIGQIGLLPVKEPALGLFVKGVIDERGLRGTSLFTAAEKESVRDVYIESVYVAGGNKATHQAGVTKLLTDLETLVAEVANPDKVQFIYGLGATRAGIRFMERRGFELVSPPAARVDRSPLYRISFPTFRKRLDDT